MLTAKSIIIFACTEKPSNSKKKKKKGGHGFLSYFAYLKKPRKIKIERLYKSTQIPRPTPRQLVATHREEDTGDRFLIQSSKLFCGENNA